MEENKLEIFKDYQGVRLEERREADLVAGTSYGLDVKILLETADWGNFRPKHELQVIGSYEVGDITDSSSCVSFSASDILEAIFIFFIRDWLEASGYKGDVKNDEEIKLHLAKNINFKTAYLSGVGLNFLYVKGYIENGEPNFSDRFIAINGHTTKYGAYQADVANGIKLVGLIPEKMLPFVKGFENYHNAQDITQEMVDLATECKKYFFIDWEWVNKIDIMEKLEEAPLQATVLFANGDGILKPEGRENHAIMIFKANKNISASIDDSYIQETKEYGWEYFHNLLKYSITDLNITIMDTKQFIADNDLVWVQNSDTGQFGRILQQQLRPIVSTDRGALALLDDKVRGSQLLKGGKKVPAKLTNEEWKQLEGKPI